MATTTKKSSKAKTKTAKAKTTKSKTVTTKATKKPATKVVARETVSKTVPAKATAKSTAGLLQKIYAISIAVYVAIAGAAYFLMNTTASSLTVGYWTKDELASTTQTVFAPATQSVWDVQYRFIVMAVALLSAVVPLLYLTRFKKEHSIGIKARVMPLRWIEMAVVSALMLETVAMLSAVQDIGTLMLIGGLMAVTCILGWMAERRTARDGAPATAKYYLAAVTGTLPWIVIAIYAVSTYVYGMIRSPWYVYALYAVVLGAGILIATHQLKALKGEGNLKNYELVERNYAVLSLVTRTAFAAILIIGLMA